MVVEVMVVVVVVVEQYKGRLQITPTSTAYEKLFV
jgi:hypothetical protein